MTNNRTSKMTKELRRFYNGETRQVHRFIPLFENNENGMVMGICMDSDLKNYRRRLHYSNEQKTSFQKWIPRIRKGQMVLLEKPTRSRMGMTYKGEGIFNLHKVYDEIDQGFHTSQKYLSQLMFGDFWSGWKDYEEVNND
jgi:hypothetical protein